MIRSAVSSLLTLKPLHSRLFPIWFPFFYPVCIPYRWILPRLCVMQKSSHCVLTFIFPHRLKRFNPKVLRMFAKTGSITPIRWLYISRPWFNKFTQDSWQYRVCTEQSVTQNVRLITLLDGWHTVLNLYRLTPNESIDTIILYIINKLIPSLLFCFKHFVSNHRVSQVI